MLRTERRLSTVMRKAFWLLLLPYLLVYLGAALNLLAITANGGLMPFLPHTDWSVLPGDIPDPRHIVWNAHVHLGAICDWIQWFDGSVWSPGDIFREAGEWLRWPSFCTALAFLWESCRHDPTSHA